MLRKQVRWLCLVFNSPRYTILHYRVCVSLAIERRLPELQSITSVSTPPSCLFKVKQLGGFDAVVRLPSRFEVWASLVCTCWLSQEYLWAGITLLWLHRSQRSNKIARITSSSVFVICCGWDVDDTHVLMHTSVVCSFNTKNFWAYLDMVWKRQLRDCVWKLSLK